MTDRLAGYRKRHNPFHIGRWLTGEFVSFERDRRTPVFEEDHSDPPDENDRFLALGEYALVRLTDLEWVDRRARVEIRVLDDGPSARLDGLLDEVVGVSAEAFDLHRLEGLVTPVHYDLSSVLAAAGFRLEATLPYRRRVAGTTVECQVWAWTAS